MAIKPFTAVLTELRYGATADELTEKLNELVRSVRETRRKGSLQLTIEIKPASKGGGDAYEIIDTVKITTPTFERESTLLFATVENNLQRNDPRQQELTGLRTIPNDKKEPVNG